MTCRICTHPPKVLFATPHGWVVFCCALFWTVTDGEIMDTL